MYYYIIATAAALAIKACTDLYNDSCVREEIYSKPLSTMPQNVDALVKEMMKAAAEGVNLTVTQKLSIEKDIYRMMSEGAVVQRNHEMDKTRSSISSVGYLLSWFMKQKGMTYEQIQAKYQQEFKDDEVKLHQKIVESASRSNKNLTDKFTQTLAKKLGAPAPAAST
jgi:methylphosphotriester-DNA--protein-cysteine methyltransferase